MKIIKGQSGPADIYFKRQDAMRDEFRRDKSRIGSGPRKHRITPVQGDPYDYDEDDMVYEADTENIYEGLEGEIPVDDLGIIDEGINDDYFDDYEDFYETDVDEYGRQQFASSDQYMSDEDIASEFNDFEIVNIEKDPGHDSGWIEVEFPEGGEHVGGGTDFISDSWIRYDNGRIAFDHWYPDDVYNALVGAINAKFPGIGSESSVTGESWLEGGGMSKEDKSMLYDRAGDGFNPYRDVSDDEPSEEEIQLEERKSLAERYNEYEDVEDDIYEEDRIRNRGVASLNSDDNFTPHGSYTISNIMGYEVELSEDGESARLRDPENGQIVEWLPIEYVYDEDLSEDDDDLIPVIDPGGYDIPLDLVMRLPEPRDEFESGVLTGPDAPDAGDDEPLQVDETGNVKAGTEFENQQGEKVDADGNVIGESRGFDGTGPMGGGPRTGRGMGGCDYTKCSPEQVVEMDPDGGDCYGYAMYLIDNDLGMDDSVRDMLQNGVLNKDSSGDFCRSFADEVPGADIGRLERAIERLEAVVDDVDDVIE